MTIIKLTIILVIIIALSFLCHSQPSPNRNAKTKHGTHWSRIGKRIKPDNIQRDVILDRVLRSYLKKYFIVNDQNVENSNKLNSILNHLENNEFD